MYKISLIFGLCIFSSLSMAQSWEVVRGIPFVYLTWKSQDTSRTLTVNYHSALNQKNTQIFFDTESRMGRVDLYRFQGKGKSLRISNFKRLIHSVELQGLKPNTVYYFVVGDPEKEVSSEFKVRTLPLQKKAITFITGGDMSPSETTEKMLKLAAKSSPHFVAIGGDIAYANGKLGNYKKWDRWLTMWQKNMVSPEGFLIPMILGVGNHETRLIFGKSREKAPFFFNLFDQGLVNQSYFFRTIGSSLGLFVLDTGHINAHGGTQANWLEKTLSNNQGLSQKIAIYHIPMFPSHRSYDGFLSRMGRQSWLEIFDKYKMTVAFENHDHTFKKSHKIHGGKVVGDNEPGIWFLGDGCWGRKPRKVNSKASWYIEKASSTVHFWKVELQDTESVYTAIDQNEDILHRFTIKN